MVEKYKFEGWLGHDESSADGKMKWGVFEPKPFEEDDIDIEVTHCGICGSDISLLRSGWGPAAYPICAGHEIVGNVVRVGSKVEGGIKVGDRVGVGAQSDSCRERDGRTCAPCGNSLENYCPEMVQTVGMQFLYGGKAMGGFANYHRVPSHFAIKIPDGIDSAIAAPMLCGGITTYTPLKKFGCGPGKAVGIVGVGGLGHFAVLWAKALGAEKVVGISRSRNKKEDSLKLGCDEYIATADDKDWAKSHANSLDLIISTVSSTNTDLSGYLALLRTGSTFVQVGVPDDGTFKLDPGPLVFRDIKIAGSVIGSPQQISEMLVFAAKQNIKPWVEERPMKDANQALVDLAEGNVRYRFCLVN